jgi:hypothetical protein
MFNKPVSQLDEEDIQTLIDNKERESSILEYKQEVSGTDHEKKEISKDISAIANTEGGYLVIGIKEIDGQANAITGTPKTIGRQPVEVWIENVLITNVRPKIAITPKVIILTSILDRVLVVIHIPQSSKRPHMVITDGRNAYYTRHNYQATYADEHEVRSMFLESKSLGDEMKTFLSSRNLNDPLDSNFAITPLSKQLSKSLRQLRELPENFGGNPFVLFVACPRYLEERVDIASSDFRTWLDANDKVNLSGLNIDFLDYDKTVSADSIRSIKEIQFEGGRRPIDWYLEISRNGYLENGLSSELMWPHDKLGLIFQLTWFTAALWQFMKFARNLYEHIGYLDEISLIVVLVDIENVTLGGFGKKNEREKWTEPEDMMSRFSKLPICRQKNVKTERNVIASELDDEYIERVVKDISKRISNAFGESIAKCFDEAGNFNRNGLGGFRNVR